MEDKMRRLATLALTLTLALLVGTAWAQVFSGVTAQAVNDVSVTVDLVSVGSVAIVNTGANPIWGQAYFVGQTPVAATIASPLKIDAGQPVSFGVDAKSGAVRIRYVVLICGAGLTSTAKVTGNLAR